MEHIYLQQYIAKSNIASRRKAIELIKAGRVTVNGKIAIIGSKISSMQDKVEIDGRLIKPIQKLVYYLVNKPIGYTSSLSDRFGAKLVTSLVPATPKVWPVGRLDKNSHGLMILTNDGNFTYKYTHPSFEHPKEYLVILNKPITSELLSKLKKGVKLEEGLAKVDMIKKISAINLSIILHQGWKRQIRRMFKLSGYRVVDLQRTRIDKFILGKLKIGEYKKIKL